MRANKLLFAAGITPVLGVAASKKTLGVNGQIGSDRLSSYCDSGGFDTITLASISASPETDPATNYPASNFGPHCGAAVYMVNNTASHLLDDCTTLSQDILHCQKLGKKVLLSVGGIWGPDPEHDYSVTTPEHGEYFAEFLWKAFGPNYPSWTGPRPFDTPSENPTVVDGFDFDINVQSASASHDGYTALLKKLRTYVDQYNFVVPNSPIVITGSPVCPLEDGSSSVMKDLITHNIFDKLWVNFYGNYQCAAGSTDLNYDAWETFLANTTSKDALLYVGLPAEHQVPGYLAAEWANALVDRLKYRSSFGGVMISEVAIAKANANGGLPLYAAIYDHMLQGAQEPMTSIAGTQISMTSIAGAQGPMSSFAASRGHVVTKTERATVSLTKTIYATASAANSTLLGTGMSGQSTETVFVTVPCTSASRTVSDTLSGTRTSPTHSYSYSVTSAGHVWRMTGLAWLGMAVAMSTAVVQAVSYLM
ncbi:Chitinase 2 [Sporothrix bragantina]|uniref:Chitinase 2 n=1 Tax=Sporothrix bragantina TaxID=671064 RepID=A0ABP0C530_9PEZI